MSSRLTLITEICTGLGMIPDLTLDSALSADRPPSIFRGIEDEQWESLCGFWRDGDTRDAFTDSFESGRHFLHSDEALRGRSPKLIEWRGPHHPPEPDPLPADLRVDHVYAVSCKNLSKILRNPSPVALFRDGRLDGTGGGGDWYLEIARVEYESLYRAARDFLGLQAFPHSVVDLSLGQKAVLKNGLSRRWPPELSDEVGKFNTAVSERSADSLRQAIGGRLQQERFYWQLMRLHSSSYFILGQQDEGPCYARILTPWDFRRRFTFRDLSISAAQVGQPQVNWTAVILDSEVDDVRSVHGHIEIRWSHGKFRTAPEGKVYLDTPHLEAPGYEAI